MFTDLTTQRVLVMEWIDGTRLKSSSQGGQGAREELQMVEIGVRCSLEQMLEEGYYHSDPHPGNLFKMKTGKLAYIDFGMMGEIEGSIRRFDLPYLAVLLGFVQSVSVSAVLKGALCKFFGWLLPGCVSRLAERSVMRPCACVQPVATLQGPRLQCTPLPARLVSTTCFRLIVIHCRCSS